MNYEVFVNDEKGIHTFQDGFRTRREAEAFACARSKFRSGNIVVREAGGPRDSGAGWISIYRNGRLNDANRTGSFRSTEEREEYDAAYREAKEKADKEKKLSRIDRIIKRPLTP